MKRYNMHHAPEICEGGIIAIHNDEGNFVKYEDVQELLDWMKDKIKEWKNDYNCGPDDVDYYGVGREESAEELEQKLREIGEL